MNDNISASIQLKTCGDEFKTDIQLDGIDGETEVVALLVGIVQGLNNHFAELASRGQAPCDPAQFACSVQYAVMNHCLSIVDEESCKKHGKDKYAVLREMMTYHLERFIESRKLGSKTVETYGQESADQVIKKLAEDLGIKPKSAENNRPKPRFNTQDL